MSSRGADLRTPLGPPDLRGDTLALPGELEATLTDHSEVAFASLDSAEYLHVQVFEPGAQRPLLKATGHRVVVRHAPGEGNLWVEAR